MACPALKSTEKTDKLDYLEEAKVVTMFLLVNLQKDHCRNKSLSLPGGHFGAAQRVWLSSALHHHWRGESGGATFGPSLPPGAPQPAADNLMTHAVTGTQ